MTSYEQTANVAATQYQIDPLIFKKQIKRESNFDPRAYNQGSGASGIAQIIPKYHPGVNVWDPVASLNYAAKWMSELLGRYGGDYAHALAAYNWGPGNVDKWNGKKESLPAETQKYLEDILGGNWVSDPNIQPSDPTLVEAVDAINPAKWLSSAGTAIQDIFGKATGAVKEAAIAKVADNLFLGLGLLALTFGIVLTAMQSGVPQRTAQIAGTVRGVVAAAA